MFNKLTNKQCAMLLAVLIGLFGLPALLLALNVAEMLIGEAQMGFVSFIGLGYMVYRTLRWINPDNDESQDQ